MQARHGSWRCDIHKIPVMLWCVLALLLTVPSLLAQEDEEALPPGSVYITLGPSLVGNFGSQGRLRYFKVDISIRVLETGAAQIERHLPRLRHTLLMLLSRQAPDAVASMEDRQQVRAEALETVRVIINEEEGDNEVEDLLFTSFVIQG